MVVNSVTHLIIRILDRVQSAKALARKLKAHPVFGEYEIVVAAGDGRLSEEDESQNSYDKVRDAINHHEKTITLSVGQLTTGITIPEWTAVLMISCQRLCTLHTIQKPKCVFQLPTKLRCREWEFLL